jgi:hypothetical protein
LAALSHLREESAMSGPSVPWKTFENDSWVIAPNAIGRFKLASPKSVTGTPTLTLNLAGKTAVIKVYSEDVGKPGGEIALNGTTPFALVDATGSIFVGQGLVDLSIEIVRIDQGASITTTDEPNGSPSAPFASTTARNAAYATSVPSPHARVWAGGVEYEWIGTVSAGTDADWDGERGDGCGLGNSPSQIH